MEEVKFQKETINKFIELLEKIVEEGKKTLCEQCEKRGECSEFYKVQEAISCFMFDVAQTLIRSGNVLLCYALMMGALNACWKVLGPTLELLHEKYKDITLDVEKYYI